MSKIIHFIWFNRGGKPAPDAFLPKWKDLNPDWEIKVWGSDDLRSLSSKCSAAIDSSRDEADVADYCRLEILAKHGGFYFDIDTEPIKPIGGLVNENTEFLFSRSSTAQVCLNACYSRKGNDVILFLIEHYESPRVHGSNKAILTRFKDRITVLPWDTFQGYKISENTHTLHWPHRLGSWIKG